MRVLLTWELGLNLGHLTRLLPIAQRLQREGHSVLVAARDVRSAAAILGPTRIRFVQAPHLPSGIPLMQRASGYADILLSQGWSNQSALWGLVQAWLGVLDLFHPDRLILDLLSVAPG
jgi:predicted glycosyltransferase